MGVNFSRMGVSELSPNGSEKVDNKNLSRRLLIATLKPSNDLKSFQLDTLEV